MRRESRTDRKLVRPLRHIFNIVCVIEGLIMMMMMMMMTIAMKMTEDDDNEVDIKEDGDNDDIDGADDKYEYQLNQKYISTG